MAFPPRRFGQPVPCTYCGEDVEEDVDPYQWDDSNPYCSEEHYQLQEEDWESEDDAAT